MFRRDYIKGSLTASLLMGLQSRRAMAIERNYDPARKFPFEKDGAVPPDEVRQLAGYLEVFELPDGSLSQTDGWTAVYDMLSFSATPSYRKQASETIMSNSIVGQVAISKRPGKSEYTVKMVYQPTAAVESVDVRIRCASDRLLSIRDYELVWSCQSHRPDVSYTRRECGTVVPGALEVTGNGVADRFEIGKALTSLWTMFDAVRILPAQTGWSESFDLYMDMSSLRRSQTLCYSSFKTIPVGAESLGVHFYEQKGTGISPIHYAVDSQQRTLFVTHGQLGWALNRIEGIG